VAAALKSQRGVSPTGSISAYISLAGLSPDDRLNVYKHAVEYHYLKWSKYRLFQGKYFTTTAFVDKKIDDKYMPMYRCPADNLDPSEKMPIPSPINDDALQTRLCIFPALFRVTSLLSGFTTCAMQ
jgi:hypothetical protein